MRVTHETLENRRWAGASLELKTSRGRVFTFETICSRTPKHKRTTISADPGMELVSLRIMFGRLVGFVQQPSIGERDAKREWYSVLYEGVKEEEIKEVREFSSRREGEAWWREVSLKCRKKTGRAALYLDTRKNKILQKMGSEELLTELVCKAETRGLYLDMKECTEKLTLLSLVTAVSSALNLKSNARKMVFLTILIMLSRVLEMETLNITGQLITVLSDNTNTYNSSFYSNALCNTVLNCQDGCKFDHAKALIISLILIVLLERAAYLTNVVIHYNDYQEIYANLKTRCLEKSLHLHQGYHDSHSPTEISSITKKDNVARLITWNLPNAIALFFGIVIGGVTLIRANPAVGGCMVVITVLFHVPYYLPGKLKRHRLEKRKNTLSSGADELRQEALRMVSTIKQFSQERIHIEEQRIAESSWVSTEAELVIDRVKNEFVEHSFKFFMLAGMMVYELLAPISIFAPGEFMFFFAVYSKIQEQIYWFCWLLNLLIEDLAGVDRYQKYMSTTSEVVSGKEKVTSLDEDILLEDLHFGYPTRLGEKVFSGLNMRIKRKKMTAIVGDSGSGKSTIAKLIMRLYDPQQGRITIGGKDIKDFDLTNMHEKMAIVSQSPDLLNTTLMANIAYGAVDPGHVTMEQVREAAELANCDFIDKFRSGLDTFAGAQGLQLSGGQKQRVAIARAAMRDPEILILDEATSALDAENEREVQEALDQLMQGKTTIVIAHRLSTIQHADEIICLKDGEVIERGTHQELMEHNMYYANLVSKQLVEDTYQELKDTAKSENDVKQIMRQASKEFVRRLSDCVNNRLIIDSETVIDEKDFGSAEED